MATRFVLQQGDDSRFDFSQVGNGNQMIIDLQPGASLRIDQVGDGHYLRLVPAP